MGNSYHVLTLDVVDGRIANCFVIRNPDKLARVAQVCIRAANNRPACDQGSG